MHIALIHHHVGGKAGRRRRRAADARARAGPAAAGPPGHGRLPRLPAGQRVPLRLRAARDPLGEGGHLGAARQRPGAGASLLARHAEGGPPRALRRGRGERARVAGPAPRPDRCAAPVGAARVDAQRRVGLGARDRAQSRRSSATRGRPGARCAPRWAGRTCSTRAAPTRSRCSARSRWRWCGAAIASPPWWCRSGRPRTSSTRRTAPRPASGWASPTTCSWWSGSGILVTHRHFEDLIEAMALLGDDPSIHALIVGLRSRRPGLRRPAVGADRRARPGRSDHAAAQLGVRRGDEGHAGGRRRVRDPEPALRLGPRAAGGDRLGHPGDPHARRRRLRHPGRPSRRAGGGRRGSARHGGRRSAAGARARAARDSRPPAPGCARSTRSTATSSGWRRSTSR